MLSWKDALLFAMHLQYNPLKTPGKSAVRDRYIRVVRIEHVVAGHEAWLHAIRVRTESLDRTEV